MKTIIVKKGRFVEGTEAYELDSVFTMSDSKINRSNIQSLLKEGALEILEDDMIEGPKLEPESEPKSEQKKFTRSGLFAESKEWQVDKLKELGVDKIPRFEKGRVDLILDLQG